MSKPGHNSKVKAAGPISADRLKSFIERIERMEEERKAIAGDIKDIYTEAKAVGYDVGTMRKVVRLRAMDAADRAEQETLLDVYWHALQTVDRIDARLAAGESQREVAAAEGVSKTTVQRRGPKVESAPALSKTDHHNPETGEITESTAGPDEGAVRSSAPPNNAPQVVRIQPTATPDPEGGEGTGTHSDEAPITPSVGAVASESERVAPDDDLTIPPHLRGPSPANRRMGT